jgi:glucokinase
MRSVSADTYLGIDIGGSALKYGWGNVSTGLVFSDKIFLRSNTLAAMKQAAFQILDKAEQAIGLECISAIGIGSPGTINSKTGRLMGVNPNLPEWSDILPSEIIPAQIGKPCYCDNDANLMTLAEANLLREKTHVIGITIGFGSGWLYLSWRNWFCHGGRAYHHDSRWCSL